MSLDREPPMLHDLNPTGRFSDRAADYVKYRPCYPEGAVAAMLAHLGDPVRLRAADVGAGTGISARQLAERGVHVFAVEPNHAMREAATPHTGVEWRDGSAEATGLEDASVDLVLAAQAFHTFLAEQALAEFRRILKPHGRLAIMWDGRDPADPLTRDYVEAIHAVNGEHPAELREFDPAVVNAAGHFTPARPETFEHAQELDRDGLIGRATSASYVPREGKSYATLVRLLAELYERHRDAHGQVRMKYLTQLFLATAR